MPDMHLYEYAIIRYVPHIEREEFINVGLVMMCKRKRWMRTSVQLDYNRIKPLRPPHSEQEIASQLDSFRLISDGTAEGGEIASLDVTERFRWLSAVRSACIQTSRPHPGKCSDLDATFDRLFDELVR